MPFGGLRYRLWYVPLAISS